MISASSIPWKDTTEHPHLAAGEVHVWRIPLDKADPVELSALLSTAEMVRAERFYFEHDRARFICGRGLLRRILGRYLQVDPCDLRFVEGPYGKPELTGTNSALRFNLSHSDDLMLLAVTYTRAVGIDLELMRDNTPIETLADYYFAPEDAWTLRLLPPTQRVWKFYEMWTSAEARLKADGIGLADGLKVVQPDRWSLLKLAPAEGYAAALAVEGEGFNVQCWSWQK